MSPLTEEWRKAPLVDNFEGGMRLDKSESLLEPPFGPGNEMRRMTNFILDERGLAKVRPGYLKAHASGITGCIGIDSFIRWERPTGSVWVIAAKTATYTKIYTFDGTTFTEVTGGGTLLDGYKVHFLVFQQYLLIYNGNVFQYMDNTTTKADVVFAGTSAYSPIPKIAEVSDGRLFVVTAVTGERNTCYFSIEGGWTTDPGTDMEFEANDTFQVDNRFLDSTGATCLWSYSDTDNLLNYTRNNSRILIGEYGGNYENRQTSRKDGCVAQHGIAETDDMSGNGMAVYVGKTNFYMFRADNNYPIGNGVWPLVKGTDMSNCVACTVPQWNSVLFTYLNGILCYNSITNGWTVFDIEGVSHIARQTDGNTNAIYFSFSDDNNLYYFDDYTYTDNGTDITVLIESPEYALGDWSMDKLISRVIVRCNTLTNTIGTMQIITSSLESGHQFNKKVADVQISVEAPAHYATYDDPLTIYDESIYADSMTRLAHADYDAELEGSTVKFIYSYTGHYPLSIHGITLRLKTKNRN
ncbi:hypothetical protein [Sulfuricurvum sp.]|uniref:hypothetical protein n=1 Tax=Sulfuricurvum sp. TaxID=2025608 RepID=UPI003569AF4C